MGCKKTFVANWFSCLVEWWPPQPEQFFNFVAEFCFWESLVALNACLVCFVLEKSSYFLMLV
jgi:hypothetical protein